MPARPKLDSNGKVGSATKTVDEKMCQGGALLRAAFRRLARRAGRPAVVRLVGGPDPQLRALKRPYTEVNKKGKQRMPKAVYSELIFI